MTGFLLLVVVGLAIWIARSASRTRENASLLVQLTSRVFNLEQELKRLRELLQKQQSEPQPARSLRKETAEPQASSSVTVPVVETPPAPDVVAARERRRVVETPAERTEPVLAGASDVPPQVPFPSPRLQQRRGFSLRSLPSLEESLGTNWLNKLGIVILVIGVALFLAYEMRELGPGGKVETGCAVSAAMLAIGVFFNRREQWRILARAAIAGGWSLLYFTTYAMYHVPAARVLSSEGLDLVLLLMIAVGMVLHTLRYSSQVVTGLAFLLAFTTVNISRASPEGLIASAILAGALAAVALRRHWFQMEIAGVAAAYLNHYLWLRPLIEPMHGHVQSFPGYAISAALLCSYWLIFRASYVLRNVDDIRTERVSTAAALLNSALFLGVMGYQSLHPERAFPFFFVVGAIELALGQLPITRRRRTAFIVLTTLGSCLLVAAFPYRYSQAKLSVSWMAEAEALLLVGVFLGEIVFRRLGMLAALLVWIQMIGSDAGMVLGERMYGVRETARPGMALLFGFAAAVFYFDGHWIPRRWPDIIQDRLERLCFQRLSRMAAILAFIGAWIAWPAAWTAVAWAVLTATLAFAGRRWKSEELSLEGVAGAFITTLRVLFVNSGSSYAYPHLNWMTERLLTISLVVALLYLASRWADVIGTITRERVSSVYTWVASALAAVLIWYELQPVGVALGWTLLGLILLEAGFRWRSPQLRFQAYVTFTASFLRLFFVNLNAAGPLGEIAPRVYTTFPLALTFYYVYSRLTEQANDSVAAEQKIRVAEFHCFFGTLTIAALLRFCLDSDLVVMAWAALALLLVAFAWKSNQRIFLDQGLLVGFGVLFRGIFHNLYERSYFPAPLAHGPFMTLGTTVALLLLVLPFAFALRQPLRDDRHRTRFRALLSGIDRRPEQAFFFVPFVLLTALLAIELPSGMVTLAWGVEAVALFALALRAKERSYRLSALGLLLLCVTKILVRDVWGLAPRDRYLTFIVLGSALLAVSYLYTRYRDVLRQYL